MFRKWWPHIRTLLITIHLLAIILKAIPAPEGGMNKADWKNPTVQAELQTWTTTFNAAGVEVTSVELEEHLWNLAQHYMAIRKGILRPFRTYYKYFGADQNWRLFVAPHMYPSKLHIDVFIDDNWVPLYRPFSIHQWNANIIETSRFRPAIFRYSWTRYKRHYRKMGLYFAKRAAEDFPTATKMRTRWWQQKSPSPEQLLDGNLPTGKWRLTYMYDLEEHR